MKTITLFLLMIWLISSVSLFAEEKDEKGWKPTGISWGMKLMVIDEKATVSSYNDKKALISYGLDVSIFYKDFFFKFKYDVLEDLDWFQNTERLEQFGFLYGGKFDYDYLRLQLAIGISRVSYISLGEIVKSGILSTEYEEFTDNAFGMPFELGVRLFMLRDLAAIGIDIIGNINNLNTVIYPTLTLEIGKLR